MWREIDNEITKFLTKQGFESDKVDPRYMNSGGIYDYKGKKAMCKYFHTPEEYFVRLFVTKDEVLIEVQTPWRSLAGTDNQEHDGTIRDIEKKLDEVVNRWM